MRKNPEIPYAVCWGAGVDSTAMLIRAVRMGIEPPAIITLADTGAEKNVPDPDRGEEIGTYDFVPVFSDWLEKQGYPRPTVCVNQPLEETSRRYQAAVDDLLDRRGYSVSDVQRRRLGLIVGNMMANRTLPSIAFARKGCSVRWKLEAQEPL